MTQKIALVFTAVAALFFFIAGDWGAGLALTVSAAFHLEAVASDRAARLNAKQRAADVADLWRRDRQ